ncbi:YppF family protein [Virgibacillus soli]|uniref:YppF family protein n=1 Tax=Paracerasibacillus soli TaxID=480284 RepID=UPI0035E9C214
MFINKLISNYEIERNQTPETMDNLLDFYLSKYIREEIDIVEYWNIFSYLSERGAVSAYDHSI